MPAICPGCGTSMPDDARFCSKCGRPVGAAAPLSYAERYAATAQPSPARPLAPPPSGIRPVPIAIGLILVAVVAATALVYLQGETKKIQDKTNAAIASALAGNTAPSTPQPFEPPAPGEGLNETARIGEDVPIADAATGKTLGSQAVLAVKRNAKIAYLTPDAGKTFVGVEVRYSASGQMFYSPGDWVTHDQAGRQYEWTSGLDPFLESGTLAAGRHVEGWITFQVSKTASHLWIDRQNSDGTVIFSVQLY